MPEVFLLVSLGSICIASAYLNRIPPEERSESIPTMVAIVCLLSLFGVYLQKEHDNWKAEQSNKPKTIKLSSLDQLPGRIKD